MVLNLDPPLEAALAEQAKKQGVEPEALAVEILKAKVMPTELREERERLYRAFGIDCGVALPDSAFLAENQYDD